MNPALETAIHYAEQGFYVFPLSPGTKIPYKNFEWKDLSTNDPEKVRKAGSSKKYAKANWALDCGRSGLLVLDIDVKKDKNGFDTLANNYDADFTQNVTTPHNGVHAYFKGEGPSTVDSLGKGLDTRGTGGYVVIPGSLCEGKSYILQSDVADPPPIPDWLVEALAKTPSDFEQSGFQLPATELDQEHHIESVVKYLQDRAPEAVEGDGGDLTTYEVACRVRDLGVSEGVALDLMLEYWNDDKASPTWSPDDLENKIHNAYKYARDTPGNSTIEAQFPNPFIDSTDAIRCAAGISISDIKPREWLLGYRYIPGYVTLTIAPGGAGKSLLTIIEGLAVASNKQLTYDTVKIPGAVWIYNTEDPFEELDRRIIAAAKHFNLTRDMLQNFYYSSGYEHPIKLVTYGASNRPMVNEKLVESIIREIRKREIRLFIVDPFVETHEVSENDNMAIGVVAQQFRRIAAETGCAVSLVHHTNKGGKDAAGNMDKARGASSLVSACRIAHTLYAMTLKEAQLFRISPERASWYVRLDDAKANLAPPSGETRWFKKESVRITPNSDESTGVLEMAPEMTPITEVSHEHMLIDIVSKVLDPGDERTAYSVSQAVHQTELMLNSDGSPMGAKNIQNKLQTIFRVPVHWDGKLLYSELGANKGNQAVTFIKCDLSEADAEGES